MPDKRIPRNATEMVDALFDFVQGEEEDVRGVPMEKVLRDLEKRGLDPGPLVRMVRERLAEARAEESLHAAREKRQRIARFVTGRPGKELRREDLKQRILEILRAKPELGMAYRKFEEATEADLESLLEDLDLLDELSNKDAEQ